MMAVTFAVARRSASTAWSTPPGASAWPWSPWSACSSRPATASPPAAYLLLSAAVLWGLRLAAYIARRNRGKGEDPRYRDLLGQAAGNPDLYALRIIYLLRRWSCGWPACPSGRDARAGPAGPLAVIGAVLWLAGFVFESVGDAQLARFKADPAHQGLIMDRGLWRYTRHPNYFGDFCMWWGLFLIALRLLGRGGHHLAPLLMTFILTRGTGAAADRPADGRHPPPVRRLRRPHQRLLPAPAPSLRKRQARRRIGGRPPPRTSDVSGRAV